MHFQQTSNALINSLLNREASAQLRRRNDISLKQRDQLKVEVQEKKSWKVTWFEVEVPDLFKYYFYTKN